MFKVTDFAKLAQISPHTLRYYDKIGLFSPERTDPDSGYRLYGLGQLAQLNRIIALRDMGFGIAEIREHLAHPANDAYWTTLLKERQAQIEAQIATEQARLRRVQARLTLAANTDWSQDVIAKPIDGFPYCSTGHICEPDGRIVQLARASYAALAAHKLHTDEIACFIIWDAPTPRNHHHVELGFRVPALQEQPILLPDATPLTFRNLPPIALAATVIYEGPRIEVQRGYRAIFAWMDVNGYSPQGYFRERYLQAGSTDTDPHNIVELAIPIEA